MSQHIEKCSKWSDQDYLERGFRAQRRYPNEELLRFLGRTYFDFTEINERKKISILEIGCGSGANLWMMAREGFDTHGLDLSSSAISLCRQMLEHWNTHADLNVGTMTEIPYPENAFDVVVDVLASCCLTISDFDTCLQEICRVLKPNGLFFTFTPTVRSDAFINYKPSEKLDQYTLDGIKRKDSPFYGTYVPFRFSDPDVFLEKAQTLGFQSHYLEITSRTYNGRKECFEFMVFVGRKNGIENQT